MKITPPISESQVTIVKHQAVVCLNLQQTQIAFQSTAQSLAVRQFKLRE